MRLPPETSVGPSAEYDAVECEQQCGEDESRDEHSLLHGLHSEAGAQRRLYGSRPRFWRLACGLAVRFGVNRRSNAPNRETD